LKSTIIRLQYALFRRGEKGFTWILLKLIVHLTNFFVSLLFAPIGLVGHFLGFRRLTVIVSRIGHLAVEPDCFLKLSKLNDAPYSKSKYFILAPRNRVANSCLLQYWSSYIRVIDNSWLCTFLSVLTNGPLMKHSAEGYVLGIGRPAQYGGVNARWGDRTPILSLRSQHREDGRSALCSLGVPEKAWFICVHVREKGYAPHDDAVHDYRNGDIETFFPAMQEVVERGGWCIRMGHPKMKPLPPMKGVIDYAHSACRSEEMDVFLAASCRFFLGDTSGLFLVSTVFGVPSALANMIPITARGFAPRDVCILKLLKDVKTGRDLTFQEMFDSPVASLRTSHSYKDCGVMPVDNTPDEIKDLICEMFARLDGSFEETPEDIQRAKLLDSMMRPDDYCYGTSSKVASTFLRHHEILLPKR